MLSCLIPEEIPISFGLIPSANLSPHDFSWANGSLSDVLWPVCGPSITTALKISEPTDWHVSLLVGVLQKIY